MKAPTGFGKTSVAISLGVSRSPAIHSVRTRNEITPVLRDLNLLRRKTQNLRFSFIHSAHNMCPLIKVEAVDAEDFWLNCYFLRDLGKCDYFEASKGVEAHDVMLVVSDCENHVEVIGKLVRKLRSCPYFSLIRLALQSNYVVVTYPYVFNPELFENVFQEREMSEFTLIVDESHMFVDPSTIYSYEVPDHNVRLAINELIRYLGGDERLEGFLRTLLEIVNSRSTSRGLRIIGNYELGLDEELINYLAIKALEIKKVVLNELLRRDEATSAIIGSKVAIIKVATLLSRLVDERFKLFTYRYGDRNYLISTAVDHSVIKDVLSAYKYVVMMSGTPPPKEFIERVVGLKEVAYVDALELGARSPYENIAVLLTTQLTSKFEVRSEDMYELYSRYIEVVDDLVNGVKLVVYPSYEFMGNVVKYVNKGFIERRDTSIDELVENIRGDEVVHAVAGGKLCEGIELTRAGRSLIKCVFVAGVPYPQEDDYVLELMRRLAQKVPISEGKDYLYNLNASIKTMQSIGRSVRSDVDYAIAVLGDRRFLFRNLRKYLGFKSFKLVKDLDEFANNVSKLVSEFL
ncbi:MAG: helicase C-terminal domain-containing protein [Sulfolobales archaeon]|nr:helicase C-terminal domain-containing protein [Sulfolobales archaeon]